MELDEMAYRTAVSAHQVVEELKKAVEQIIQFLERTEGKELDLYVKKEE